MKNISAVDTSIIKGNDIWYLLTSVQTLGTEDNTSELHIYYS